MNQPKLGRLALDDVQRLFSEGYSPAEIAAQAEVKPPTASRWMRDHGMDARPRKISA